MFSRHHKILELFLTKKYDISFSHITFETFCYICLRLFTLCLPSTYVHLYCAREPYKAKKMRSRCPRFLSPNTALPLHICGGHQTPPDAPHRPARRGVFISKFQKKKDSVDNMYAHGTCANKNKRQFAKKICELPFVYYERGL